MNIFLGLIIAVATLFFLLGLKSQKGKAKGVLNGKLAEPLSTPNSVSSEEGVQPEKYVQPLIGTLEQIKAAITATGGIITSESDHYLSATYMSKIFKFIDDVEIRRADKTLHHIRSASRVGYSDQGVNRKRVEAIRNAIQ